MQQAKYRFLEFFIIFFQSTNFSQEEIFSTSSTKFFKVSANRCFANAKKFANLNVRKTLFIGQRHQRFPPLKVFTQ